MGRIIGKDLQVGELYVNEVGQVILITKILEILDGHFRGNVLRVSYITSDKKPAEFKVPKEHTMDIVHIDSEQAPLWLRRA